MKKSTNTSALFPSHVKWVNYLSTAIKSCFFVFFVLVTGNLFSQTISFPTSCSSGDLTLLSATLPAPAGDRCNCNGDRVLVLGIRNGTNSFRTSFALWGTLTRTTSTGQTSLPIFACANGVKGKTQLPPNGDNFLVASTIEINGIAVSTNAMGQPVVHINCGESFEITNLHLAWTSANDNETCDVLKNNPSIINPKCGVLPQISIGIGVQATRTITNATCTELGKIKVEPSGGLPNYQVCLDGGSCQNVAAGAFYQFSDVAIGTHTVTVTDNMSQPATARCSITYNATITQPDQVGTPSATVTSPSCSESTGSATINSFASDVSYTLKQGGVVIKTANSSGVCSNVAPGTYDLVATKGACSATNTGGVIIQNAPSNPTFTVCITQPTLCTLGSLTINASGGSNFQYSINGGTTYSSVGANTFNNLKTGDVTSVKVKNGAGCFSGAVLCANLSSSCPPPGARISTPQQIESSISTTTVKAYPNPFSDRVKFMVTSTVAGNGNLEIYNMMGQKVKTVYQGYIAAGTQVFELSMPKQQVANMVYVLRVGDKKLTGKILQVNQ